MSGSLLLASVKLANARVSVFDDASVVDTGGGPYSESDNVQASLSALGHSVTAFSGTNAADFQAALSGAQVVLFPEFENGNFVPDSAAQDVIRGFVASGGTLIMHGDRDSGDEDFLNTVFGLALAGGVNTTSGTAVGTGDRAGTTFADDQASLPNNNGTYTVQTSSLPTGALSLYEFSGNTAVAALGYGTGQIVLLAYDWFDAAPTGSADGGWLDVLDSAISTPGNVTVITGTEGDDALTGTSGSEVFDALGGNDWIMTGGSSNRVDGGAGVDMVSYADRSGPVDFEQATGTVVASGFVDFLTDVEGVTGTSAGDIFRVSSGTIRGLGGDDTFFFRPAGRSQDFDGGSGWDLLSFTGSSTDTSLSLFRGRGFSGDADGITISGIEQVRTGTGNDEITGDHGNNVLMSLAGNDTLIGIGGNDTLHGGDGVDVAVFSYDRDQYTITTTGFRTIVEYIGPGPGDGRDVVDFVEILRFVDGDVRTDTILGTPDDDWLYWQSGKTVADGLAGYDRLDFKESVSGIRFDGASGMAVEIGSIAAVQLSNIEVVRGSAQADSFIASAAAERFEGAAGQDVFIGGGAGDLFDGGASVDTLQFDSSTGDLEISLLRGRGWGGEADGLRVINIENLRGGAGDDMLTGDHGANRLEGGVGDDTLEGNGGDDYILAGLGNDVIVYSGNRADYTITQNGIRTDVIDNVGSDGHDILGHAEVLRFADGDVFL